MAQVDQMRKASVSAVCLLLVGCLVMTGCQASARPLSTTSRRLLSVKWGGGGCGGAGFNNLGFGTAQALAMPGHNLILGQVHVRNNGARPFGFSSGGVRLSGSGGAPLNCNLRCPQTVVPAGGSLQCGFIAQAPQPLSFTSFTPYFVPQSSGSQCFTQQPFNIRPYATPAIASSQANAFSNAGVAKSFADACAQAFGAAYSDALSQATSWNGDAFGLANSIANSVFGSSTANSQANAQAWNGAASANGNAVSSTGFGPASAYNQANALSNQAAFANGNAVAQTAFGPAQAQSASNALQTGWGGIAAAADQATAVSGNGPAAASSQSNAVNNGGGPAIASSSATAVSGSGGCGSSCGK